MTSAPLPTQHGDPPEGRHAPTREAPDAEVVALNDLTVVKRERAFLARHGLDTLDALFDAPGAVSLDKPGLQPWRRRLRLTLTGEHGTRTLYLKRYTCPPARARRAIRRSGWKVSSHADLEWRVMRRLAELGIPSIRPLAYGARMRGRRELSSAILTEAVPGDALERMVERFQPRNPQRDRALIHELADLVGRLHRSGAVHRDLYLSHVFHDPDAARPPTLYLIDVQRVFAPATWRRYRWIVKDLASLNYALERFPATRADRVRWLRRYLAMTKLGVSAKRLARDVRRKTRRIARHDERRSRRPRAGSSGA